MTLHFNYFDTIEIEKDQLLSAEFAQGFKSYIQRGISASLSWDRRDYPNSPLSGAFHSLTVSRYDVESKTHISVPDPTFYKYDLDLRHYYNVGEKQVLAWHFLIGKIEGHSVPFSSLYRLGGSGALRGYLAGRYRDKAVSLSELEYRKDVSEKFALAGFVGIGVVAPDIPTLDLNRRRHAVGIGAHYIADPENRQKFRLDVGYGEDGSSVYVVFGEAF